jgi:hypothetical protein
MRIEAEFCTRVMHVSLAEYNSGTIQKLPFGVNPMIKLKNITSASLATGTTVSL